MGDVQRSIANAFRDAAIHAQKRAARAARQAIHAMEEWEREERLARNSESEKRHG